MLTFVEQANLNDTKSSTLHGPWDKETDMHATQSVYFADYRSLKMTRDSQGVLIVEFHTNGGPLTFTAQDHTEFVDAFYRISQDRANKIVILTGAGGEFIPGIDFSTFGNTYSRKYLGELNGCACRPSHSSPASRMICSLTPAM